MATEKYEAEFTVDNFKGTTTGTLFTGKFKVRTRLSFRDQLRRDEIRRSLLGPTGTEASQGAAFVASLVSEMSVRVIDSPKWWTASDGGMELADLNVLSEVFALAVKAEQDLVASLVKDGDKAQADLKANQPPPLT
jgi:hypothetical protein